MYKKYDSTLLVQIEAPAIVRSFCTEQKSEIKQIEVSAISTAPMEMVIDALIKGIAQMKEFNERIDKQYPNSVLAYVG
jgi:hypothetical protein